MKGELYPWMQQKFKKKKKYKAATLVEFNSELFIMNKMMSHI